jgi:hypothetical protein
MLQRKKKSTGEKQEYIEPVIPLNFNNEKKNMAQSVVINLVEPEKKKKKKKQKKKQNLNKSEEVDKSIKSLYQQTLTKYIQGNYPPLSYIPDIRNITNNDLLSMVNEMKIRLKEPVVSPSILTETTTTSAIPTIVPPSLPVLTETSTKIGPTPAMAEPIKQTQLSPPIPEDKGLKPIPTDEENIYILFDYFNNIIQNHFDKNLDNDQIELMEGLNFYYMNKDLFDKLSSDDKEIYLNTYINFTYPDLTNSEKDNLYDMFSDCFEDAKSSSYFDKSKKLNFTSPKIGKKSAKIPIMEADLTAEKAILKDEQEILMDIIDELKKDKETLTQRQLDILKESEELKNNLEKLNDEEIKKYILLNKDLQNKLDETIKKLNTRNQSDLKDKISKIEISKRLSKAFNPEEQKPRPKLVEATTQTTTSESGAPAMVFGGGGFGGSPIYSSSGSSVSSSGSSVNSRGSSIANQSNLLPPSSGSSGGSSISSGAQSLPKSQSSEESVYLIDPKTEKFVIDNYDNNYNYIGGRVSQTTKNSLWVPLGESIGQKYNRQKEENAVKNISTTFINDFKEFYLRIIGQEFNIEEEKTRIEARPRDINIDDTGPISGADAGLGIRPRPTELMGENIVACRRRTDGDRCNKVSQEDIKLLYKLEADNDLDKLQILYKKYYGVPFEYQPNRTTEGNIIDIVYAFKNNGKNKPLPTELPPAPTPSEPTPTEPTPSEPTPTEPTPTATATPTKEDLKLLNTYEQDEDLEQLQNLYKKYYNENYVYKPNRKTEAERTFDIVEDFKRRMTTAPSEPTPEPTTQTTEIPEELKNFMNKYYIKNNEGIRIFTPTNENDLVKPNINELQNIATKFIIPKIDMNKENKYKAVGSNKFYDEGHYASKDRPIKYWANALLNDYSRIYENMTVPDTNISPEEATLISNYKNELFTLNSTIDVDKINLYYNGLLNSFQDVRNASYAFKKNATTSEKLQYLVDYRNDYQYIRPVEAPTPEPTVDPQFKKPKEKLLISDNEVELCLEVCKATYLDPSARERIAQLDYDDSLSNTEVAIYRDLYTQIIYFGSRGSQSAEDWLQSDLAIVFGEATPNYSPRLNNEITILNQVLSIYRPTTIIYTGHSLAAYLSNELFIYTLKDEPSITQAFSIGFNGGQGIPAYYRNYPFNENFINTHVLQFHVKGDVLSRTQAFAPFGTLVTVPRSSYLVVPNHFLSAFDSFNFEPYSNFVNNGLTIPNSDQVIGEETTAEPTIETDKEKNNKLMNYFNQLWEMDRDADYDTTETFKTTEAYYNKNREYFDDLNNSGGNVMMITNYIDNKQTIRPKAQRYLFFINLYNRFRGPDQELGPDPDEVVPEPEDTNRWQDYEGGTTTEQQNRPEYETPYGGYIGGALGTLTGGLTSGGNPIVAGGAGAAGFLAGNAIQNAISGRPSAPQPIAPSGGGKRSLIPEPEPEPPPISFGGGRRGTVLVPSTM